MWSQEVSSREENTILGLKMAQEQINVNWLLKPFSLEVLRRTQAVGGAGQRTAFQNRQNDKRLHEVGPVTVARSPCKL